MMCSLKGIFILIMLLNISNVMTRKHFLNLSNDERSYFKMSSFGYLSGGKLVVSLKQLQFPVAYAPKLGFTLTKTRSETIESYVDDPVNKCFFAGAVSTLNGITASFHFDFKNNLLLVRCHAIPFLEISSFGKYEVRESQNKKNTVVVKAQDASETSSTDASSTLCRYIIIPFKSTISESRRSIMDLEFIVYMKDEQATGVYSLYFHNCAENEDFPMAVNLSIGITEQNGKNYLSAGEILLPNLYLLMCIMFLIAGMAWIYVVMKKRKEAFKIHFLMGVLLLLKSLSLCFHGINYYILAKEGIHIGAWAVMYYITHLFKEVLLLGTIWAFVKHVLSDLFKKIFMIVIPLQIIANVAKTIVEESEIGQSEYYTWKMIFVQVDLVFCAALLLPYICSFRHLHKASQTNVDPAMNLEKLKLYRHFYVMIVCYIYFTRIIPFVLKITVPFQYEWMDEAFKEAIIFILYIVTGVKFQPTTTNSYYRLSQEDDIEKDKVITQTGPTEKVPEIVRSKKPGLNEKGIATKHNSSLYIS